MDKEEKDLEQGDSIDETPEEDKTSEENEEKTSDDKEEEEKDKEEKDETKAEIAQKKHWREKYKSLKQEFDELKTSLTKEIKKDENISADDAEKKAQAYIDGRIEEILKKREARKEEEKRQKTSAFEEELDEVIEDNPDFTDKQILDVCEKLEITPKVAIKVLQLNKTADKKKPNMPSPKQASSDVKVKEEERKTSGDFWKVTDRLLKKIGKEG